MSKLIHCYNKGCGNKYDPEKDDKDGACQYHPGPPYFHEGYKIWNCCNKKSTDFTTWLSYPGCTKGRHNPIPPPDAEKPFKSGDALSGTAELIEEFKSTAVAPRPPQPASRTDLAKDPLKEMTVKCSQMNKDAIQKKLKEKLEQDVNGVIESTEVAVGTQCKNSGCNTVYDGEQTSSQCWYHNGVPVFHEGCKFWSCCNKKTTDFEAFLTQEGCTSGKHAWTKPASAVSAQCRFEWYQTASEMVITVYSRNALLDNTKVFVNSVTLQGHVTHNLGDALFNFDWSLWGAIDIGSSVVTLTPAKLEFKLKKLTPQTWPRLCFNPDVDLTTEPATNNKNDAEEDFECPELIMD